MEGGREGARGKEGGREGGRGEGGKEGAKPGNQLVKRNMEFHCKAQCANTKWAMVRPTAVEELNYTYFTLRYFSRTLLPSASSG